MDQFDRRRAAELPSLQDLAALISAAMDRITGAEGGRLVYVTDAAGRQPVDVLATLDAADAARTVPQQWAETTPADLPA